MATRTCDRRAMVPAGFDPRTLLARLQRVFARLRARLAEERRYRRTLRELMSLSDQELDDIGLSRARIREVAREAARRSS